jgi:hypothetical protein
VNSAALRPRFEAVAQATGVQIVGPHITRLLAGPGVLSEVGQHCVSLPSA